MTQTEHATKVVGSRTEMPDLTEEFHTVTFLLQRVAFRIGSAVNFNLFGLDFHYLAFSLRFNERPYHAQA